MNHTLRKQAIERARNNVATRLNQSTSVEPFYVGISNASTSNEQIDTQFPNEPENDASCKETEIKSNTSYELATIKLLLSDARPYQSTSLVSGSIKKAMGIVDKEEVSKSFEEGSYFVKSYTQRLPRLVSSKSTGNISCDKACERYMNIGFCAHVIAVALYIDSFEKHISYLNKAIGTITSFASKTLNKRSSGRKMTVQRRIRSLLSSHCKDNQFITPSHIQTSSYIYHKRVTWSS